MRIGRPHPPSLAMQSLPIRCKSSARFFVCSAQHVYHAKHVSVLGFWGKTTRDAVRNTEKWKRRRVRLPKVLVLIILRYTQAGGEYKVTLEDGDEGEDTELFFDAVLVRDTAPRARSYRP